MSRQLTFDFNVGETVLYVVRFEKLNFGFKPILRQEVEVVVRGPIGYEGKSLYSIPGDGWDNPWTALKEQAYWFFNFEPPTKDSMGWSSILLPDQEIKSTEQITERRSD